MYIIKIGFRFKFIIIKILKNKKRFVRELIKNIAINIFFDQKLFLYKIIFLFLKRYKIIKYIKNK
jgi:hypothetical protein